MVKGKKNGCISSREVILRRDTFCLRLQTNGGNKQQHVFILMQGSKLIDNSLQAKQVLRNETKVKQHFQTI